MQRSLNARSPSPSLRNRPSAHQRSCRTSVSNSMLRSSSLASAPMRCLQQGQRGCGCQVCAALHLPTQQAPPAALSSPAIQCEATRVCAHPSVTPSRSGVCSCRASRSCPQSSAALTARGRAWERWRDKFRWEAWLTGVACCASAPAIPLPVVHAPNAPKQCLCSVLKHLNSLASASQTTPASGTEHRGFTKCNSPPYGNSTCGQEGTRAEVEAAQGPCWQRQGPC